MITDNITNIELDAKTADDVQKLRKAMEQIIFVSLLGFVLPIVFPCMIALGIVYAFRRRKILNNQTVVNWLAANESANLNQLAKQPTIEGGVARIKVSAWRPWIPMIVPVVSVVVFIGVAYATGTM